MVIQYVQCVIWVSNSRPLITESRATKNARLNDKGRKLLNEVDLLKEKFRL